MPVTLSYPGVYIEEIPSEVRTIVGVATSITAFIGRARRGPVNTPTRVQSFAEYQRSFGNLWLDSTMSYGVQHYFLNGGTDAIIVRIENGATAATITLPTGDGPLTLEASSVGAWGNDLRATVDHTTSDSTNTDLFNLVVDELNPDNEVVLSETFRNVSMDADAETYVVRVLEQDSNLVLVQGALPADRPSEGTQTATASSGE